MTHPRFTTLILLAAAWLVCCPPARAVESALSLEITAVRVGFDGAYKVGYWTPVIVTLHGGKQPRQGQIALTVPDGDGTPTRITLGRQVPLEIPAGQEKSFLFYAKFGRVHGGMVVEFTERGGGLVSRSFTSQIPEAALASQQLVVTVGQAIGVKAAVGPRREQSLQVITALIERAEELPDRWIGYDGVDVLILTTSRLEIVNALTNVQLEAIDHWVRMGGRLLLSVGANGEKLLGPGKPLARFAPGRFVGVEKQRETGGLETYTATHESLPLSRGDGNRPLPFEMSVLSDVSGRIDAYEGSFSHGRAMIVRRPYSHGQITFVAVDLDQPPFFNWNGRTELVARLLDAASIRRDDGNSGQRSARVTHVGYEDLVGQLRGALDRFSGVQLVHFSWVAVILLVYIALIGPGDYFLLRRVIRRMQWTWLTFPLIVTAFCLLSWSLATWCKGSRLRINQVDVVDFDVESSLLRGTTWAHIYSPRTRRYSFTLRPRQPARFGEDESGVILTWQGLPGKSLAGMNTSTASPLLDDVYTIEVEDAGSGQASRLKVSDMPIQIWSTKSLLGRWWSRAELPSAGRLAANSQQLLEGHLINPLPFKLTQCTVYYNRWAYELDYLEPGQRIRMITRKPRNLEWLLTARTIADMKERTVPWDRSGVDVPRIMQIMMFHKAAGGRGYTRLLDRYQGFVDLSDHLQVGRAILVGRAPDRAADLQQDGKSMEDNYSRHWTFYRIVLPVVQAEKADKA